VANNSIPTRVAHAEVGDNRFWGYSVAEDLAGKESWLGIVVLGVTGRRLNESERGMLDDLGVVMTIADPRVWPLKITRLAAAYGNTLAGLAGGLLTTDEALIGHWTFAESAYLLRTIRAKVNAPTDLSGIETACRDMLGSSRRLRGFGVAARSTDERVTRLVPRVEARLRHHLEYWTLFKNVADSMLRLSGLAPNIGSAAAAICLDLGFDDRETGIIGSFLALSDYLANASEGAAQMPSALQTLDLASVHYVGPPPRESGRTSR
jgi:citrate synthase